MLEQAGISLKGLNIDKLKAEYQELTTQKKELTATYKNCDKELKSLNRKLENLNQYLGRTEPQKGAPEQPDRNKPLPGKKDEEPSVKSLKTHRGNVHNSPFRHGQHRSQDMEKQRAAFPHPANNVAHNSIKRGVIHITHNTQ